MGRACREVERRCGRTGKFKTYFIYLFIYLALLVTCLFFLGVCLFVGYWCVCLFVPDGRAQPVQNSEPVQTGRLRAPDGESVPPNAEEDNTAEGEPGAVQDSPLAESQPPETVTAEAETGVEESEGAAEERILGGEREDSAEEMEGEHSDFSFISDIPDSQPFTSKKKLYTLEQVNDFMTETKGKRGVEIESFFPDLRLFLHSAHVITRKATVEEFDQPKRYRF